MTRPGKSGACRRQRHADALGRQKASSRPRWIPWRSARTCRPSSFPERNARAVRPSGETSTIRAEADGDRPQLPREDQREHRQLRGDLPIEKKSRDEVGVSAGAATPSWTFAGRNTTRPRVIPPQLPCRSGPVRSYQALESVEGKAEELTLGDLPRDTLIEQAEQGRRSIHDLTREILASLHPADREARHRSVSAPAARSWPSGASRTTRDFLYTKFDEHLRDPEELRLSFSLETGCGRDRPPTRQRRSAVSRAGTLGADDESVGATTARS